MMDAQTMNEQHSSFDIVFLNKMDDDDDDSVSSLESEASFQDKQRNSRRRAGRRLSRWEIPTPMDDSKRRMSTFAHGKRHSFQSLDHHSAAPIPPQRQPSGKAFRRSASATCTNEDNQNLATAFVTRVSASDMKNDDFVNADLENGRCVPRGTIPRRVSIINDMGSTPGFFQKRLPPRVKRQGTTETALSSICQSPRALDKLARHDKEEEEKLHTQRLRVVLPNKKPDILKKPRRQISSDNISWGPVAA